MLLGLINKFIGGLQYHMGEDDGTVSPYIVFPLWSAADIMIVTPEGEDAPEEGSSSTPDSTTTTTEDSGDSTEETEDTEDDEDDAWPIEMLVG